MVHQDLKQVFAGASRANVVHLCIDLQRSYIDAGSVQVEQRIGREIAPSLSAQGVPTYWVYYDVPMRHAFFIGSYSNNPRTALNDLSPFVRKRDGDLILPKLETSAMTSDEVSQALKTNKKKILLVSGFSYMVCVRDTIVDARDQGYDVILMSDATDYDPLYDHIEEPLKKAGAIFSTSSEVRCAVQELAF